MVSGRLKRQLTCLTPNIQQAVGWPTVFAVAILQVAPAYADIVAATDAGGAQITATTITPGVTSSFTQNGVGVVETGTQVTTGTIRNNVGFNAFSEFNVDAGENVHMVQPTGTDALVNLVTAGGASQINGQVSFLKDNTTAGSRVFFVNSDGFIVGATGAINAGNLTLSTPTAGQMAGLIAEADGSDAGTANYAALYNGTEDLNASANIEIYGQINAERLELRAGGRMILNGQLTVEAPVNGGTIAPAVSTDGIEQATGVSVENGVIRLFSGGDTTVGSTARVTAKRQSGAGGLVHGAAGGAMTVAGGAIIDVAGTGSGDAGAVILYGANSAALAAGTVIDASAVAGAGGFAAIHSGGDATVAGEVATGSGTGSVGAAHIKASNVTLTDTLTTGGGDLAVVASNRIIVSGSVNTRQVAVGGDVAADNSTAASGDLLLFAPRIDVTTGASLRADANNGQDGGLVGLIARDKTTGVLWTFEGDDRRAEINVTGATLDGGAVLINAYAEATNVFGDDDAALTEFSSDFESNQKDFEDYLDSIADTWDSLLDRSADLANDLLIPLQSYDVSAEAEITITNATITGDGNWKGAAITPTAGFLGNMSDDGVLQQGGQVQSQYDLFTGAPIEVTGTVLPSDWDPTLDAVYIHSHATTEVEISPLTIILAAGIAITDTESRVKITGSDITSTAGDVTTISSASEAQSVKISSWPVAGIAAGFVLSLRDLDNQLIIDGGSINAAGDINADALTGVNVALSNIADSYSEGRLSIATTINIADALTEAVIGGDLDAGGAITVNAETVVFDKTTVTNANMGLEPLLGTAVWNHTLGPLLEKFKNVTQSKTQDDDKATEEDKKPGSAVAAAIDVQIDDTNTYASIGGSWHDGSSMVALGATDVAATGSVDVNAAMRFAGVPEGGQGLTRDVQAAMGSLDKITKAQATLLGLTEDELTGTYGKAKFINLSMGWFEGETVAEIGDNVTLSAVDLDVNALTSYPSITPAEGIRDGWNSFMDDVADIDIPNRVLDGSETTEEIEAPDLLTYLDPYTYVTTEVKAKAIAPVAKGVKSEQEQAIAVSLQFFSTQNDTVAAVRSGADLTLSGDLAIKAVAEGLFVHVANLAPKNPIGSAKTEGSVGGTITINRTASDVEAVIEDDVVINAGDDVTVEALNDIVAITQTFMAASAKGSSINAALTGQIIEARTSARVSDTAQITADEVTIEARDQSILWSIAGGVSKSGEEGVGASGAVNFITRDIDAGIGRSGAPLSSTAGTTTIDARTLTIDAVNDALDVSAAIAGSKVHGKIEEEDTDDTDNEEFLMTPNKMLSFEEYFAISQQKDFDTEPDETGETKKTGWSAAGSASLNLILLNEVDAELETQGTIDLTGDLNVTATSNELAVTVAGSAATAKNEDPDQKTNALAGALALTVGMRDVRATISAADIDAAGVTLEADDVSMTVGVAAGGAKSSNADKTIAGSVVFNWLTGETTSLAEDTVIDATGDVEILASDESVTAAGGGALSMNASKTEGYGVGVGVASNVVDRKTRAELSGASDITAANLRVSALTTAELYGIGFSYAAGRTGGAGSVANNTWIGGATALIDGTAGTNILIDAGSVTVDATESAAVWNLAGAVTRGGNSALGGALSANTIVGNTKAQADNVTITGIAGVAAGAVTIEADATSDIGVLAVAGAKASDADGVGFAIAVNTVTADTDAGLTNALIANGTTADVQATSDRSIVALGGGVAQAGKNGAGFALTTNTITSNGTTASVDGSDLTLSGNLTVGAENDSDIWTLAAGISVSKDLTIGGGVSVNVLTGNTLVSVDDATIDADRVILTADDATDIDALSGGAAKSGSGTGAGGAISANVIVHDAAVEIANSDITTGTGSGDGLTATATNTGSIEALAAGLSYASGTSFAGAIAVGDIGNSARVEMAGGSFDGGDLTLDASKTATIDILSGSAAISTGGTAVGGGITVALIHGETTADLLTPGATTGGALSVTATNDQDIDAIAVAGSYGGGSTAVAGSLVYTQIGTPPTDGPSVEPLNAQSGDEDPAELAQDEGETARDDAFASVSSISGSTINATLDQGDVTGARVELGSAAPDFDSVTIAADETSATSSLSGVLSGGSSSGFGASIAVNLIFGEAEAELILPDTADLAIDGDLNVTATQDGTIETLAAAGSFGGSKGGAGSVVVNVMNREALARIASASGTAALSTTGGDVTVNATQTGTIDSLAGTVAGGGSSGFGGSVAVTVQSDDARVGIDGVSIAAQDAGGNGEIDVRAVSDLDVTTYAVAAGGAGSTAFGGSVAVTVADGTTEAIVSNAELSGGGITIDADATLDIAGIAGAISGAGSTAVGMGVVTNVTALDVDATVDNATLLAAGNLALTADADTTLSGLAVSGSAGGSVAIAGSAVANTSSNTVDATLQNGSAAIARDTAVMNASAATTVELKGGAEDDPGISLSFAGGGSLGIAASVVATLTENTAQATVTDGSMISGAGEGMALDHKGIAQRGTVVGAQAETFVDMVGATAGAGGTTGVAGVFAYTTADDTARVRIGEGTEATAGVVGGGIFIDQLIAVGAVPAGTPDADVNADQDVLVRSEVDTTISTIAVGAGVGGSIGGGAAGATTIVTSKAETLAEAATIGAARHAIVDADVDTTVDTIVAGGAGGYIGLAASGGVTVIEADALTRLAGTNVSATTGNLDVTATNRIDNSVFAGGVAGGFVGAAGAVGVTVAGGSAIVEVQTEDRAYDPVEDTVATSRLQAGDAATVRARTDIDSDGFAASGAGGTFGLALSANVTLVESTTQVAIDAAQTIISDDDITIEAREEVDLAGTAGGLGAGLVGIGASMDYARLSSLVDVTIGSDSVIDAGGAIDIDATSVRDIDSTVAVAGAGALAAAAAISVVEVGGTTDDSDRDSLTADVQTELSSANDGGSADGGASDLSVYAGADGIAGGANSARQSVVVDRQTGDAASVNIGDRVVLRSGEDLTIDVEGQAEAAQLAGALSISAIGVSSGTAVAEVSNDALITLGDDVQITSGGDLTLATRTGNGTDAAVDARAATIAGSALIGAGVGVAEASGDSQSQIVAGGDLTLSAVSGDITVAAERTDIIQAETFNFTLAGSYGAGTAVAVATNEGDVIVDLEGGSAARMTAEAIDITANDDSAATAEGVGSTVGIIAGLNGVVVTAENTAGVVLTLGQVEMRASDIDIAATASSRSVAKATGVAAGAAGVGASVARASTDVTLTTTIASIDAEGEVISINTRYDAANGDNARSTASSSSGGLIAGNGADAEAELDYDLVTDVSGRIDATDSVTINASAADASAKSDATGHVGGLAAAGAVLSAARHKDTATVTTRVRSGSVTSDDVLTIAASNAPSLRADTESGSGGVVSGSSSRSDVDGDTQTLVDLGQGGALLISGSDVSISAGGDAMLGATLDNLSAAAVGYSGARSTTTFDTDVDTRVRGTVDIIGYDIAVGAANAISRPQDGFNITSGSGGLLDVAAVQSKVTVSADTDVTFDSGVTVTGIGDTSAPGDVTFAVATDIDLTDRVKLDAGGAIAVPVGESTVKVTSNDADLTLGDIDIFTVGDLTLLAGGDTYLKAEADSKSYGLAGAATANSEATYYGDHGITVGSGARLEALGNIAIKAGHTTAGIQDVTVLAESRVFNKTAIPIPTDPKADALADTSSRVDIQSGAEILAVRDVALFAEEGGRDVVGYGRGKDLYREVAAAIANAVGSLVGADDVSLDIESGSSTDNGDNGITVNGSVRSGARNQQIIEFNEDYSIGNSADENRDGITWSIAYDQVLAQELQDRINELDSWINDPELSRNTDAVNAWNAERSLLAARMAGAGSTKVDIITVNPIVAVEGNIDLRADYVEGGAGGLLSAPGDAEIRVESVGTALLKIEGAEISATEGGRITMNDVRVRSASDIAAQSEGGGAASFAFIDGESSNEPTVVVKAFGVKGGFAQAGFGSISIVGDIANPRGLVQVETAKGDLDISADISGKTLKLTATEGNLILGYVPGIREVGSTPEDQYRSYFDSAESRWQDHVRTTGQTVAFATNSGANSAFLPRFNVKRSSGGLTAGRNIFISADTININGAISAGQSRYDVNIGAGIDAEIAGLGAGSGRLALYNPAGAVAGNYQSTNISGDVAVFYNYATGQLELDTIAVEGGMVEIYGDIISTGYGSIQALDGFGQIDIQSAASTPLVINRLDLGSGGGIQGLVRITDTSKTGGDGNALVTEFRRSGNNFEVWNSTTSTTVVDPDTGLSITTPSYRVSSTAGRSGTYTPTQDRDYIVLSATETVEQWYEKQEQKVIIGIKKTKKRDTFRDVSVSTETVDLGTAPFVGASIGNYDYYFKAERIYENTITTKDKYKTHDSVKWYKLGSGWRHWRTDKETTTRNLYEHRLRADYGISVNFAGGDTGGLTVNATGDVIFADTVAASFGTTNISSASGDLFTAGKQVELAVGDLNLSAVNGSITGLDGAFRIDQAAGARLTATARDTINLREMQGDMNALSITATGRSNTGASTGNVTLYAQGTINQVSGGTGISGMNIDVTAEDGGLGSSSQNFIVNTDGGTLTARARGDIFIEEASGDLGINTVVSDFGSVTLTAPGRIVDRNDVETTDVRKQSELEALWFDELQLVDTTTREAEQIEALEAERTHAYRLYWTERNAAGGAAQTFALDATVEASLRAAGWTDDMVNAYVAERQALYTAWNAEGAFDPNYSYSATAAEQTAILDGIGWTADQLTRSVRAGLVRQTGDTVIRVEDPNISAYGNITLNAGTGIGELLDTYVIAAGSTLSNADLAKLAAAEKDDITVTATGDVEVRQLEDLDFAFTDTTGGVATGRLTMIAGANEIYSGAETAATIDTISGTGDVQLRIDGEMRDALTGDWAIRGAAIVLEAGDSASIGTEADPLRLDILAGGGITARAGGEVNLAARGAMPIDQIFAGTTARLTANGAVTDNVGSGLARIVADDIVVSGTSIGTGATPLIVTQNASDGSVRLISTAGDQFVETTGDATVVDTTSSAGGSLTVNGNLALGGTGIGFGAGATYTLSVAGDLDASAVTGTAFAGGTLDVTLPGGFGATATPVVTALGALDLTITDAGATPVNVTNTGDLVLDIQRSADAGSDVAVSTTGTLSARVNGTADIALTAGEITEATLVGDRVTLLGTNGIGTTSAVALTANTLVATSSAGAVDVALTGNIVLETISAAGDVTVVGNTSDIDLTSGLTSGGSVLLDVRSLDVASDVTIAGGAVAVRTAQHMTLTNAQIGTSGGDVDVDAGTALTLTNASVLAGTGAVTLDAGTQLDVTDSTVSAGTVALGSGGAMALAGSGIDGTNGVTLTSLAGLTGGTTDITSSAGAVALSAAAALDWSAGDLTALGAIGVGAGGDATFADVDMASTDAVSVTAGGVLDWTLGTLQGTDLALSATQGMIVSQLTIDGDSFDATAGTTLGASQVAVTTTGAAALTSGGNMALANLTVNAASLSVTSGADMAWTTGSATIDGDVTFDVSAALTLGSVAVRSAAGIIDLTAGSLDATATSFTTAGGDATLATTGAMMLDTVSVATAGGAARLASGGGLGAVASSVTTAGGDLDIAVTGLTSWAGGGLNAGTGALTVDANGDASLAATSLSTDGSDLTVDATGALTMANVSAVTAGGALALTMGSGTLTDVSGSTAGGEIRVTSAGDLNATRLALTSAGGVMGVTVGGTLTGDTVDLDAGAAALTLALGNGVMTNTTLATDGTDMAVTAAGDLSVGATSAMTTAGGALQIGAGNALTLADLSLATAGGALSMTSGGDFALTRATATTHGGAVAIATGNARVTDASIDSGTGEIALAAAGTLDATDLDLQSNAATIALSATGATQLTRVDVASAGGDVSLGFGATTVDTLAVAAGIGAVDLDVLGTLNGTDLDLESNGADITVTASGATDLTHVAIATHGGAADLGFGAAVSLADGTIQTSGGAADLTATGDISLVRMAVETGVGALSVSGGADGTLTDTRLATTTGDLTLQLAGGLDTHGSQLVTGAGLIDIAVTGAADIAGSTVATAGGAITAGFGRLTMANGAITSSGGDLDLTSGQDMALHSVSVATAGGVFTGQVGRDLTMGATSEIATQTGTLTLNVDGDAQLSRLVTLNATDTALAVTVDGTVTVANANATVLTANAAGALTTLTFGASGEVGPTGLKVSLDRLDAEVANGDVHLAEADALIVERLIARDGSVDLLAGGDLRLTEVRADGAGATATLASKGNLLSDGATIAGDNVQLFAFGGRIGADTATHFTADTDANARIRLFAQGDVAYAETDGDLILDYAMSQTGNLDLVSSGRVEAGVLGTPNDLTIVANGDISVQRIGGAAVDLADEVALSLIEPALYGTRVAEAPRTVTLEALPDGSELYLGYGRIAERVTLRADTIDAQIYDTTPDGGITAVLTDGSGGVVETVDVDFMGDGPAVPTTNPWADPRPAIADRGYDNGFTTGFVTLEEARLGYGEVTHAGPAIIGETVQIAGDVWVRQRSFDVLNTASFAALDTEADAQILAALNGGEMSFIVLDEFALQIQSALVVNRKLGGVSLNGGQGFGLAVAVETGILSGDVFNTQGGTTSEDEDEWLVEQEIEETDGAPSDVVRLPLILAQADGGLLR
ncbi:MAG: leukotoxin LktA family filamentous adhesin [Pseudomonadota bacterium]